jgi:hypothetical protein
MKTIFFAFLLAVATLSLTSCDQDSDGGLVNDPVPELTADEIADLIFTREEEKLARDVYQYAFDQYGQKIFENIAASEQTHMDRMGELIQTFQLDDPIRDDTRGVFQNEDLRTLYQALTAQADESLSAALAVGATIEDLDIRDLNVVIARTTQEDIRTAYEMLRCGSGNHLRGFLGQLEQNGGSYTPQYLSADEYQLIIEGSHEHCGR